MKVLCLHGISKDAWNRYSDRGSWHYDVARCGFKYNMSDISAAIGIHQLRKQERFVETRTRHARLYNLALGDIPELELAPDSGMCRHSWHLYALRLRLDRLNISRADFIRELRKRRIGASVHFIPIPLFTYFAPYAALPHNHCPKALALYPRLVSLPLYPAMTAEQVIYVADAVKELVRTARKRVQVAVPSLTPDVPAV
jgi:dTDP-4-amino-4,6-dideoxygalactose transaminase